MAQRHFPVLVYHDPLLIHFLGVAIAIYFHHSFMILNGIWLVSILKDTADGSEIPFPTTVWMVLKPKCK